MVLSVDAAHREGPGPQLGFDGRRVLLREMFFPQHLVALRGRDLRHTLDVHRDPLAAQPSTASLAPPTALSHLCAIPQVCR